MTKAIIFDIDGTLYESRHFAIKLILADPLNIFRLAAERKSRKLIQGKKFSSGDEYYDSLFLHMGKGDKAKAEKCRKWFWHNYMPNQVSIIRNKFRKRPGLLDFILKLKSQGYKVAVLSDYGMAAEKLSACGLDSILFDGVWESPELGGLKPCPEVFSEVCRRLGCAPEEAVMIGDRVDTDGGATKIGMQFIHLINKEEDRGKHGLQYNDLLWNDIVYGRPWVFDNSGHLHHLGV